MANLNIHPTYVDQIISVSHMCYEISQPLMIWGDVGIGKSSMVHQFAKQLEINKEKPVEVFVVNCSGMSDPTDIRGLPMPNKDTGKTEWFFHELLPDPKGYKDNKICIVFLDELPSAHPSIQIAMNELLLSKSLGSYKLPPGSWVVAAGNRGEHGNICADNSAIADRVLHISVEANASVWLRDVAIPNNIHPYVITYLERHGNHIHTGEMEKHNSVVLATPRSWETVSDLLYVDDNPDAPHVSLSIMGMLGATVANTFRNEILEYIKSPPVKDLLSVAGEILNAINNKDNKLKNKAREELGKMLPHDNNLAIIYTNNNLLGYLSSLKVRSLTKDEFRDNINEGLKVIIIGQSLSDCQDENLSSQDFLPGIVEYVTRYLVHNSIPNESGRAAYYRYMQGFTGGISVDPEIIDIIKEFWGHPIMKNYRETHGKEMDKIVEILSSSKNEASSLDNAVEDL